MQHVSLQSISAASSKKRKLSQLLGDGIDFPAQSQDSRQGEQVCEEEI